MSARLRGILTQFMVVVVAVAGMAEPASPGTARSLGDGVFSAIDRKLPGYGTDVANTRIVTVHDMALGWYLVAAVQRNDLAQARIAADQLLATRHKGGTAAPGWGLGFAWDAFGDGTMNAPQTVYGITTAIAVRGLFDFYDATREVRYRNAALEALSYYYQRSFVRTTGTDGDFGAFWYSNTIHDRSSRVFNVISMLMGQYARAYAETGNATWKNVATLCFRYMWAHRRPSPAGLRWPYHRTASGSLGLNDGVHAAFVVQGLIDYQKYLPARVDLTPAVDHLAAYRPDGEAIWSVAQLIFTLTEAGRTARARHLRDTVLPAYRIGAWRYGMRPGNPNAYPRMTTQLAAGLLRLERADAR